MTDKLDKKKFDDETEQMIYDEGREAGKKEGFQKGQEAGREEQWKNHKNWECRITELKKAWEEGCADGLKRGRQEMIDKIKEYAKKHHTKYIPLKALKKGGEG